MIPDVIMCTLLDGIAMKKSHRCTLLFKCLGRIQRLKHFSQKCINYCWT